MKSQHNPVINLRYWILISLASIFGTNTGDQAVRWYNQAVSLTNPGWLGLKHAGPLPYLVLVFIILLLVERRNTKPTELFFWSAIILIRTAATNIADTLAGDLKIDTLQIVGLLSVALLLAALKWQKDRAKPISLFFTPKTTATYWLMMLIAGVLGTVCGDYLGDAFGLATPAVLLSILMVFLVSIGNRRFLVFTALYWLGIVVARIAGTDVGDWLAKSSARGGAGIGLLNATLLSGLVFITTLVLFKSKGVNGKPIDAEVLS